MTYEPGASASRTKTFTDEDVRTFAHLTGDTNPVHLDADYAATTVFGQRIVHGMLTSALISAVLANDLPGPGTIYLGQNLKFKKPVFIGDTITATVTISQVRAERKIVTFETTCTNQNGEVVIEGEATVKVP
ncbi:MAG: (R)-specific enoyl-CoA hydratase [Chloroflexota bacterium]|nr:MaoC family dehydratase [Chloroflexota bacterium]NOG62648.1 MaoC family dehydratase [Chloroflexota bacterium]GIK63143.1 MAG: (R)-specific enoyl-CoA hydratase [Chloroflexota bacterium]